MDIFTASILKVEQVNRPSTHQRKTDRDGRGSKKLNRNSAAQNLHSNLKQRKWSIGHVALRKFHASLTQSSCLSFTLTEASGHCFNHLLSFYLYIFFNMFKKHLYGSWSKMKIKCTPNTEKINGDALSPQARYMWVTLMTSRTDESCWSTLKAK